ncbi:hypothetical protein FNF07_14430 [Trinickia caryophylli]|uniref:hypothetical protein n=1 Tax=Trinickia caryophylli TaxID=28094 RepID=UPI00117BEBEA|nr:hypothetical protein [Trinickia caryophylli]TRX19305.1 hypothetical protein FNF07_14430 [Trinickia caryophylli]
MRDAVDTALAGVLDHLQACRQRGHLSPEQRGVLLLREQYLKRWRASVGELRNPTRLKLSHRDRDTIATAVRVLAPRAGLQAHAVLAARMVSDLKHLDLRTLEAWLHEAGMPGPRPDEAGDALPAIRLAAAIARGRPIKPADTTHSAFREALRDIVAKTPLGNNVRYFDGGTWGLNVNTSLNMRDFTVHKAGLGVSLGPGIKALQGRHAFLEIGSSSYGGEIFMGTDTRYSTGAAIGLFGGAAVGVHGLHFAFGAGGGVAYSHDRSAPSGVIVRTRLRRDEGGKVTDSWRTHASAVIDFLYEQGALAASARRPSAETLWERFSERFFREPDISVNWREQRRSSHTVSENAGIMARLALSGLRIGPALNATRDTLLAGKNERIDANGWLRGVERTRTRSRALTGSAALVGAVASAGHFSGHAGYPESVSIPSVPIVGAMSTFAPHGASVVLRIVDEHGRLNAKYIRSLVEFVDPRAFAAHVERRRGQIARTDGSNARLDAFLREVKACAIRGNQAYGESLKIRPDVADTLSAYEAEIETLARCANGSPRGAERDEIARLRQRIGDLLADPQSWKVSGYYTYEINTRGYAAGPAMIVQATAATSTAGERVLAELAVSELEALDDPVGAAHGDADGVH